MRSGRSGAAIPEKVGGLLYSALLWPLVPFRSVLDASDVPDVERFVARWEELRAELRAELEAAPVPPFRKVLPQPLIRDDRWRALVLKLYGPEASATLDQLPVLRSLLDRCPDITTVIVSVLQPGTSVPWHVGILKGVVRCHLPLEVPEGDVALCLGRRTLHWEEGVPLVFDDTYPHRVWNRTDHQRVVLLLDIIRPMRWAWLDRLNRRMIARLSRSESFAQVVEAVDARATRPAPA